VADVHSDSYQGGKALHPAMYNDLQSSVSFARSQRTHLTSTWR